MLELPYFEFGHYVLANVNVHKVIPIVIITLCAFASLAAGWISWPGSSQFAELLGDPTFYSPPSLCSDQSVSSTL